MGILLSLFVLFLAVVIVVLIHICIVGRALGGEGEGMVFMVDGRRRLASTSMTKREIEKLPCFDFTSPIKGSSPAAECAVCLENFRGGEKCRLLPSCNHSFHADCVDTWLLKNSLCPVCRTGANLEEDGSKITTCLNATGPSSVPVQTTEDRGDEISIEIQEESLDIVESPRRIQISDQ